MHDIQHCFVLPRNASPRSLHCMSACADRLWKRFCRMLNCDHTLDSIEPCNFKFCLVTYCYFCHSDHGGSESIFGDKYADETSWNFDDQDTESVWGSNAMNNVSYIASFQLWFLSMSTPFLFLMSCIDTGV